MRKRVERRGGVVVLNVPEPTTANWKEFTIITKKDRAV